MNLFKLRSDLLQKAKFIPTVSKTTKFKNCNEFCVFFFEVSEYQNLAQKAISVLIRMLRTYLCEEGFFALAEIKTM